MNNKKCGVCGELVGDDHYASVPSRHKECHRKAVRVNRQAMIEEVRAYDRARGNRQTLEYRREYARKYPERVVLKTQQYRRKYPERYKATTAVSSAIAAGKLIPPAQCQVCEEEASLHAHHHDYSKPFDVWWLCGACHGHLHKLMRSVERREGLTGYAKA